jgi:hypothetical protein
MSRKKNPFNIKDEIPDPPNDVSDDTPKKKKSTNKKYAKKDYSNEQIKGLLVGYIEVPKDKWSDIPTNSHIRYFKKDGTFVRGGFVTNHWLNKQGKPFIHLANNFKKKAPGYATWPMAHESVSRIFKKPDANSGIEMDVVRGKTAEIIGQINKLVDVVKQQKIRLDAQDADMKRIHSLIRQISRK